MRNFLRVALPKLVLLLIGLVGAVLLVEVLARFGGLKKDAGLEPRGYYAPHAESGYVVSDSYPTFTQTFEGVKIDYWSNEIGCFDKPLEGTSTEPLALLVGDSFTWGFSPYEAKWGTVVEDTLGDRVLKCGVNGYGTSQELNRARDIIERTGAKPKMLIVGYFYNDLAGDYLSPAVVEYNGRLVGKHSIANIETGEIKSYSDAELADREANFDKYCKTFEPANRIAMRGVCWLKKHSVLYPYLKDTGKALMNLVLGDGFYRSLVVEANPFEEQTEFLSFVDESQYPWLPAAWNKHLGNLEALSDFAKSEDMELVVTLIPYKAQVYPKLADQARLKVPELDLGYAQERMTDFLEREGIRYVDLTADFAEYAQEHAGGEFGTEQDLYWTYDGHWNARGNRLAGLLVSRALLDYDFLDLSAEAAVRAREAVDAGLADLPSK